ncbi:hypothetical protein V866_007585 [Kwoniella sp. B9012]
MSNTCAGSSSQTHYIPSWEQSQSTQSINKSSHAPISTDSSLGGTATLNSLTHGDGDADFQFDPLGSPVISPYPSETELEQEQEQVEGNSSLSNATNSSMSESETMSMSRSDNFVFTYMSSSEAWKGDDIERSYHSYDPNDFDLEPIQEEEVDGEEKRRGRRKDRVSR